MGLNLDSGLDVVISRSFANCSFCNKPILDSEARVTHPTPGDRPSVYQAVETRLYHNRRAGDCWGRFLDQKEQAKVSAGRIAIPTNLLIARESKMAINA